MRAHEQLTANVHRYIANTFRTRREQMGLSMLGVAEQAGLSQQMVSYLERGIRNPSLDTLLRISTVLKIDLGILLTKALRHAANNR